MLFSYNAKIAIFVQHGLIFADFYAYIMHLKIKNIRTSLISAAAVVCIAAGFTSVSSFGLPQREGGDVFVPISKYIQKGDAEKLSAWFANNLEMEILGSPTDCSKVQATQIMKNFFAEYTPKHFTILHKSGNPPMKYAIGNLTAGGENFRVILLVRTQPSPAQILQIRIERSAGTVN